MQTVPSNSYRTQALDLAKEGLTICNRFLSRNLPQWRAAAVSSSNFSSAFRLSACGLQLGVAQLGLVRAAEGLPRGALPLELGGSRELGELRKGVVEQVRGRCPESVVPGQDGPPVWVRAAGVRGLQLVE